MFTANRFEMNQLVLYAERLPDSVQQRSHRLGLPPHGSLRNGLSLHDGEGLLERPVGEGSSRIRI
jgi:hypothetical protein